MQDAKPQIFHLNLERKWFDMIVSGEKQEEYREIKPYWNSRMKEGLFKIKGDWLPPEAVILCFSNGYSAERPTVYFEAKSIRQAPGRESWGAEPDKQYWVIDLGEKLFESPQTM